MIESTEQDTILNRMSVKNQELKKEHKQLRREKKYWRNEYFKSLNDNLTNEF